MNTVDMPTAAPARKVVAASTAAAVTTFVLWLFSEYVFHDGVPAPVAGLIALAVPAGLTFLAGYITRRSAAEVAPTEPRQVKRLR